MASIYLSSSSFVPLSISQNILCGVIIIGEVIGVRIIGVSVPVVRTDKVWLKGANVISGCAGIRTGDRSNFRTGIDTVSDVQITRVRFDLVLCPIGGFPTVIPTAKEQTP